MPMGGERNMPEIGSVVVPAYNRMTKRQGVIIGYTEDGNRLTIKWDDQEFPQSGYLPAEVKKI